MMYNMMAPERHTENGRRSARSFSREWSAADAARPRHNHWRTTYNLDALCTSPLLPPLSYTTHFPRLIIVLPDLSKVLEQSRKCFLLVRFQRQVTWERGSITRYVPDATELWRILSNSYFWTVGGFHFWDGQMLTSKQFNPASRCHPSRRIMHRKHSRRKIMDASGISHQPVSASSDQSRNSDLISQFTKLTALMALILYHAAKDGIISQRRQARAAAAATWTTKGNGTGITASFIRHKAGRLEDIPIWKANQNFSAVGNNGPFIS